MAKQIQISILTTLDARGAKEAEQWIAKLTQAQKQPAGAGMGGASAEVDKLTASSARAATAQQNLATAQQKTATATNQTAVSAQRLATEEQRTAAAAAQAGAAHARAETAVLRLSQAQDKAASGNKSLTSQFSALSSAAGQFGVALGAGAIAKGVLDLGQLGAQSADARDSFTNLAQSAGTTSDILLTKLHAAAAGTVSDTQLMIASNTGLLLAGEKIATSLPRLLEIARAAAKATGKDVGFLYDSLVLGISRGSPKIIDNAGITLDAATAMDTYAKSIGKTADQLTSAEQQQATLNAVLTTGDGFIQKIGLSTDSAAVRMQRATAASDNLKAALGERLAPAIATVADGITNLLSKGDLFAGASGGRAQAESTITTQATSYEDYVARVNAANQQLRDELGKTDPVFAAVVKGLDTLSPSQFAFAQSLIATGTAAQEAIAKAQGMNEFAQLLDRQLQSVTATSPETARVLGELNTQMLTIASSGPESEQAVRALAAVFAGGEVGADAFRAALDEMTAGQERARQAALEEGHEQLRLTGAHIAAAQAADTSTQALAANTQQSLQASIQSQQLSEFQATLASLGAQVAGGLMTSANAAAVLASQYNIAGGEALRLIQLQAQLANAQATAALGINKYSDSVQRMITGGRSAVSVQESQKQADAAIANAKAIADAKRDQVLAVGTANQQIKQREADLAEAERRYGTQSAQYINAETALRQEKASAARGAGRAAGAAKLSDQAKLNNQLLANEEKFEQQMQDAEKAHTQKLLDIEKAYQEKSLAQQRENEVSKRESRADFYDNLTSATKDIGAQQAQAISAEYEAAYAKSQEIAQSGNQKLADDYLKMKQRQLNAELEYQKKLKEAQKNHDKDEVARLQATHKLRQDANAEEEKQLLEGGDANQKARQDAIDAENQRYGEQTTHISEQAGRAADAKVTAAQRAGKAVDDENSALQRQLDLLHQIGTAAGDIPTPGAPPSDTGGAGNDTGSAGGDSAAAGGGKFLTHGPTTLTVGDNPGGVEMVQVTPLSGRGQTRVGGGMARMAGGGNLIAAGGGASVASGGTTGAGGMEILNAAVGLLAQLLPQIQAQSKMLKTLRTYQHTLIETTAVFKAIGELRAQLSQPTPAIDPAAIMQLADDTALVTQIMIERINPNAIKQKKALGLMLVTDKVAVDLLKTLIDLRNSVANAPSPIDPVLIRQLADEVVLVLSILESIIVPVSKQTIDRAKRYAEYAGTAIGVLKDAADLQKVLGEPTPAILPGVMERLAALAVEATRILESTILPIGEEQAAAAKRYQETASAAVSILSDTANLGKDLADPVPPITNDMMVKLAFAAQQATRAIQVLAIPQSEAQTAALKRYQESAGAAIAVLKDIADMARSLKEPIPPILPGAMERLAALAAQATRIVLARAVPLSEEQAAGLKRYQESQGAAVSILKDTADLGKALAEPAPAVSVAAITRLADEAKRIAQIVLARMVPASEEQDAAAKRYAETTSSAISVLKDTLELPAKMFTDYQSPTNAQIDRVVADANRIVNRVNQAASVYSTDGLAAAKAFGEATGAILSSFKEQLLFAQALNSGDFVVNPKNLALFEQGMGRTLAVAGRLGAQAAAIPAGNIAALQSAAEALTASYDSLVKLSAVPFGNLPQVTGGLAGATGGGSTTTFNNTFILPAGTTQQMGQQILGTLQQQLTMRK